MAPFVMAVSEKTPNGGRTTGKTVPASSNAG
jgi:hypothetical protein